MKQSSADERMKTKWEGYLSAQLPIWWIALGASWVGQCSLSKKSKEIEWVSEDCDALLWLTSLSASLLHCFASPFCSIALLFNRTLLSYPTLCSFSFCVPLLFSSLIDVSFPSLSLCCSSSLQPFRFLLCSWTPLLCSLFSAPFSFLLALSALLSVSAFFFLLSLWIGIGIVARDEEGCCLGGAPLELSMMFQMP